MQGDWSGLQRRWDMGVEVTVTEKRQRPLNSKVQEHTGEGSTEGGAVGFPTECGNMYQRIKGSVRQKLMPMGIPWWVRRS